MNKTVLILIGFLFTAVANNSLGSQHYHVKHNMILFGESETFASHIVYKRPHNFQVVLKVKFSTDLQRVYLLEKKSYPNDQFIFLLDEMDISNIRLSSFISGSLFRHTSHGQKLELGKVFLDRSAFSVIYFNELPISLQ